MEIRFPFSAETRISSLLIHDLFRTLAVSRKPKSTSVDSMSLLGQGKPVGLVTGSAGSGVLQSRIIGSFGDPCDYLLSGALVCRRVCYEDSNCNAPSIWE